MFFITTLMFKFSSISLLRVQSAQRRLVPINLHHARSRCNHGLGARQSSTRSRSRNRDYSTFQFLLRLFDSIQTSFSTYKVLTPPLVVRPHEAEQSGEAVDGQIRGK